MNLVRALLGLHGTLQRPVFSFSAFRSKESAFSFLTTILLTSQLIQPSAFPFSLVSSMFPKQQQECPSFEAWGHKACPKEVKARPASAMSVALKTSKEGGGAHGGRCWSWSAEVGGETGALRRAF